MNLWIIAIGEPMPLDSGSPRLLRAGLLSSKAAAIGVDVTWWNSSFDHTKKIIRNSSDYEFYDFNSVTLKLLKCSPYKSNVSLARIRNHKQVAADFANRAPVELPPDIIFVAYPTIELCEAAISYALPRNIPVVVDMRDLWPDIFLNLMPRWTHWLLRFFLVGMFSASGRVCSGATAITGITEPFVDWGVARAGRDRNRWDRAFPLAYKEVLPEAVRFSAAAKFWSSRGLDLSKPIICFFGTLGRQFDIPCLIHAARQLQDTPLQIVICGTGDRLDEFRQLASSLANVHFPGWVDAPAINSLMKISLAGVAPYFNEKSFTMSIPNKAIEYLAGGLPVISTLSGQLEKLLIANECGVVIKEGDSQALADAFRRLLNDKMLRESMSKNARKLYESNFVSDVVYKSLVEHLQLIVKHHNLC